jgi:large subunit ribosomal protein L10e
MNRMGKRPSKSYRHFKRPNTRTEYWGKSMDVPEGMRKVAFGNTKATFPAKAQIFPSVNVQVSARAIVAVRVAIHRELSFLGEDKFRMVIMSYPHQLVRSHGLVGVAKAERISSGMGKCSWGFPEMRLARVRKNHPLFEVTCEDDPVAYGLIRRAFRTAMCKLPPSGWKERFEGFSAKTKSARVILPKRAKEKKASSGIQVEDLQKELS